MKAIAIMATGIIVLMAAACGEKTSHTANGGPETQPNAPAGEPEAMAGESEEGSMPDEAAAPAEDSAETGAKAEASVVAVPAPAASEKAKAPESALARAAPPAVFAQCRACHSIEPGRNAAAPTFFGIVGRKAASVPGFMYSPALQQSGIVWNRGSLDQFIAAPFKMVPGTRMVNSVADPQQRKEVIDYLASLK